MEFGCHPNVMLAHSLRSCPATPEPSLCAPDSAASAAALLGYKHQSTRSQLFLQASLEEKLLKV